MNNNIDILMITPLGWDKYIWKNVISKKILKEKKIQYIEYRGNKIKNKKEIYEELNNNIKNLKENAVIVSSSYGSVSLLNFLNEFKIKNTDKKKLIILEGLDTIPNKEILEKNIISEKEKIIYKDEEEYINTILEKKELNYNFKKELSKKNLFKNKENKYEIITKEQDILHFLKIFSEKNNKEIIKNISSNFKKIIIYSNDIEDLKNNKNNLILYKNKKENHLVMIEKEDEIRKLIDNTTEE